MAMPQRDCSHLAMIDYLDTDNYRNAVTAMEKNRTGSTSMRGGFVDTKNFQICVRVNGITVEHYGILIN